MNTQSYEARQKTKGKPVREIVAVLIALFLTCIVTALFCLTEPTSSQGLYFISIMIIAMLYLEAWHQLERTKLNKSEDRK